jgi:hypothetical protein
MSSIVLAGSRTSILPNDHEAQPTQHWLKGWAGPRTATRTDPARARTRDAPVALDSCLLDRLPRAIQ